MITDPAWTCPPIVFRAHLDELRTSGRRAIARSTELLLRSQELLRPPAPDSFAGRSHYDLIPLCKSELV